MIIFTRKYQAPPRIIYKQIAVIFNIEIVYQGTEIMCFSSLFYEPWGMVFTLTCYYGNYGILLAFMYNRDTLGLCSK